jgi:glycosyltransferase involved in cell wall biosynthesis
MRGVPKVSVIVSTYNRAKILSETLDSILNQTFIDFELIVVSDCSTDSTLQILNDYSDHRLFVYSLPTNCGLPGMVRNYGIEKSKGDYIAFCDDDDIWLPNKLSIQIEYLEKYKNVNLLSSNALFFPGIGVPALFMLRNKFVYFQDIVKGNMILTPSVIVRKSVIQKVGSFDEDLDLRYGEDLELWLRILSYQDGSILILKNILLCCRLGNKKISQEDDVLDNIAKSTKYIYSKYISKGVQIPGLLRSREAIGDSQKSIELFRQISLGHISFDLFVRHPFLLIKIYSKIALKILSKQFNSLA